MGYEDGAVYEFEMYELHGQLVISFAAGGTKEAIPLKDITSFNKPEQTTQPSSSFQFCCNLLQVCAALRMAQIHNRKNSSGILHGHGKGAQVLL